MAAFQGVSVTRVLSNAMRTAELSHRQIANNIANIDTPHFTPREVDFDRTLRAYIEGRGGFALRTGRPRHFDMQSDRSFLKTEAFISSNDFNKVDLDDQMAKLSKNTGRYNLYASLLRNQFSRTSDMLQALQR